MRIDAGSPAGLRSRDRPSAPVGQSVEIGGRGVGYRLTLFAVIGTALPIKELQFLLPLLYVVLLVVAGEKRTCRRLFKWGAIVVLISSVSMVIDALRGRDVSLPGLLFALLGYLPVFTVFCSDFDLQTSAVEKARLVRLMSIFVVLEAVLGMAQFAAIGNPDAVAGTFGLFSEPTIVQVYYTFVLFNAIFFLYAHNATRFGQLAMLLGLLACILAQSGHQTIFVLVAIVAVSLVSSRTRGTVGAGGLLVLAGFAAALMNYFYPSTRELAANWFDKVVLDPDSLKRQLLQSVWQILADPKNLLLGTGLGQFCSRGALIASGDYLVSASLPAFLTAKSGYFVQYLEPLLSLFNQWGEGSAISKPYFSAASWLVEAGGVMFSWTVFLLIREAALLVRGLRHQDPAVVRLSRALAIPFLLFVLCTFIENYAEFALGTFLPAVLYVLSRSELRRALVQQFPTWDRNSAAFRRAGVGRPRRGGALMHVPTVVERAAS
jgi:hypothetical protein